MDDVPRERTHGPFGPFGLADIVLMQDLTLDFSPELIGRGVVRGDRAPGRLHAAWIDVVVDRVSGAEGVSAGVTRLAIHYHEPVSSSDRITVTCRRTRPHEREHWVDVHMAIRNQRGALVAEAAASVRESE